MNHNSERSVLVLGVVLKFGLIVNHVRTSSIANRQKQQTFILLFKPDRVWNRFDTFIEVHVSFIETQDSTSSLQ